MQHLAEQLIRAGAKLTILRESTSTSQHLVRKEGILRKTLSFGRSLHVRTQEADTRGFSFLKCLTTSLGLES